MANTHAATDQVHTEIHGAFGSDEFGRRAEAFARLFGTPKFLMGQTIVVLVWIGVNVVAASYRWDPYPFILLNLGFSLQAAYAAPLILLAQTRQADRTRALSESDSQHREDLANAFAERQQVLLRESQELKEELADNTNLTKKVVELTELIHRHLINSR